MATRHLILMEPLPISQIVSVEFPLGIPKSDDASITECRDLILRKLQDHATKYTATGWSIKDIHWTVNPSKTSLVGAMELERPD